MKTSRNKLGVIGFKEFREGAEKYIALIEKGASFTVLRRSKPIFKLAPVDEDNVWESVADFTEIHPDGISARDVIKALREVHG